MLLHGAYIRRRNICFVRRKYEKNGCCHMSYETKRRDIDVMQEAETRSRHMRLENKETFFVGDK